jgi:hypothetical protein
MATLSMLEIDMIELRKRIHYFISRHIPPERKVHLAAREPGSEKPVLVEVRTFAQRLPPGMTLKEQGELIEAFNVVMSPFIREAFSNSLPPPAEAPLLGIQCDAIKSFVQETIAPSDDVLDIDDAMSKFTKAHCSDAHPACLASLLYEFMWHLPKRQDWAFLRALFEAHLCGVASDVEALMTLAGRKNEADLFYPRTICSEERGCGGPMSLELDGYQTSIDDDIAVAREWSKDAESPGAPSCPDSSCSHTGWREIEGDELERQMPRWLKFETTKDRRCTQVVGFDYADEDLDSRLDYAEIMEVVSLVRPQLKSMRVMADDLLPSYREHAKFHDYLQEAGNGLNSMPKHFQQDSDRPLEVHLDPDFSIAHEALSDSVTALFQAEKMLIEVEIAIEGDDTYLQIDRFALRYERSRFRYHLRSALQNMQKEDFRRRGLIPAPAQTARQPSVHSGQETCSMCAKSAEAARSCIVLDCCAAMCHAPCGLDGIFNAWQERTIAKCSMCGKAFDEGSMGKLLEAHVQYLHEI